MGVRFGDRRGGDVAGLFAPPPPVHLNRRWSKWSSGAKPQPWEGWAAPPLLHLCPTYGSDGDLVIVIGCWGWWCFIDRGADGVEAFRSAFVVFALLDLEDTVIHPCFQDAVEA